MTMGKALMIQGTTSDSGKSFTVAALCRILAQEGYKVAPFKSQNMALNSFITHEGLEMGRAQVMQAEAAGIAPLVAMNPILLKPTGDTGSQVIVNGEVLDNMTATDYYAYKAQLKPAIMEAYESLASTHDYIIIEGAGSPAEINLNSDDIVNMGMARMANAPVFIVGDIDRGGVFASLYGTVALLRDWERAHVKGTIINKFRGDVTLLESGLHQLEDLTKVPNLGVVPYMRLDIDDEDSLSTRITATEKVPGKVDIAVIRLPHISNFTDLNPLSRYHQVSIRYVNSAQELGNPDLIVIPGAKNTMFDLRWMHKTHLTESIRACAAAGTLVLGVCGGFQMLGRSVYDPHGVEEGGREEGLGLLPTDTVFTTEKARTRVEATTRGFNGVFAPLAGKTLSGYEIHMGTTTIAEDAPQGTTPFAQLEYGDGRAATLDGCVCGNVMGTYCHGLFEDGSFPNAMVELLCQRTGIQAGDMPTISFMDYKNQQYDLLAEGVRNALDMDMVKRIIEEGM